MLSTFDIYFAVQSYFKVSVQSRVNNFFHLDRTLELHGKNIFSSILYTSSGSKTDNFADAITDFGTSDVMHYADTIYELSKR